jgi:hypothetical protein
MIMHDDARPARRRSLLGPITGAVLLAAVASLAGAGAPGADDVVPPSPTLGMKPPALDDRTTVLFDGTTWSGWHRRDGAPSGWTVQDDGSVLVKAGDGDAITDLETGDFQLHVEFLCPLMPDQEGQARGNSGVYLHGRYEVQVLDTHGIEPAMGGCAAIYSIAPAMVNATRPPGTWQTYDILFRAPKMDASGGVTEPARVTVLHNGVVVHNNLTLPHSTPGGLDREVKARGPLLLQDHGNPVRYRNIWIRPLD